LFGVSFGLVALLWIAAQDLLQKKSPVLLFLILDLATETEEEQFLHLCSMLLDKDLL
tara:strand:- start:990 stop:1160 length:171 start_codon:yes stop_codon:yes gene_type:complete